ncbi:MAG: hypothetical protein ACREH4_00355 [Vitreimonas sp.]
MSDEMLQHNSLATGRRAHLAHAAVVSLHALCCGLPALALLAATVSGAATSIALLSDFVTPFHELVHRHEIWVLALSALLVALGGALEIWGRLRPHRLGFPWLFAVSAACFALNVVIVVSHRAAAG